MKILNIRDYIVDIVDRYSFKNDCRFALERLGEVIVPKDNSYFYLLKDKVRMLPYLEKWMAKYLPEELENYECLDWYYVMKQLAEFNPSYLKEYKDKIEKSTWVYMEIILEKFQPKWYKYYRKKGYFNGY